MPRPQSVTTQQILSQLLAAPQQAPISSYGQLAAQLGATYLQKRGLDSQEAAQRAQSKELAGLISGSGQQGGQLMPMPEGEQGPGRPVPGTGQPNYQAALAKAIEFGGGGNQFAQQLVPMLLQGMGPQKHDIRNVGNSLVDVTGGKPREIYSAEDNTVPKTRTFQQGEENVTQEWNPKTKSWEEIGRGSRTLKQETLTGELSKTTGANLQEQFFNAQAGLDRLKSLKDTFKPEFLTIGGRLSAKISSLKELAGLPLDEVEKKYLGEFTEWRTNSRDNLNRYIKEITGNAMTNQEAGRIKGGVPTEDDSPTEYISKYNATVKQLQRAVARTKYALTQKKPIENFSLDKIDSIIDARGDELEKNLRDAGMPADQIRNQVTQKLREEFGL